MAQKLLSHAIKSATNKWLLPRQFEVQKISSNYQHHAPNLYMSTNTSTEVSSPEQHGNESTLLLTEEDRRDFFRLNDLFTLEDLIKARVHFAHKEGMLNGYMRPYIFGKRLGVHIFDLEQTSRLLKQALNVTAEISYRTGIILFVGDSRQTNYLVEDAARDCGEYAYCRRWRDAVFTNSQKTFGAVTRLPDLVLVFNVIGAMKQIHSCVTMSAKMLIPTIGICDSNCDPTLITYPVPGNDDSPQSVEFYSHVFKTAVMKGKEKKKEIIEKYGQDFYYKTLEV